MLKRFGEFDKGSGVEETGLTWCCFWSVSLFTVPAGSFGTRVGDRPLRPEEVRTRAFVPAERSSLSVRSPQLLLRVNRQSWAVGILIFLENRNGLSAKGCREDLTDRKMFLETQLMR